MDKKDITFFNDNPLKIGGDYWEYYINMFKYALFTWYKWVNKTRYKNIYSTALFQLKEEQGLNKISKKMTQKEKDLFIDKKISNWFIILIWDRLGDLNDKFTEFSKEKESKTIYNMTLKDLINNVI